MMLELAQTGAGVALGAVAATAWRSRRRPAAPKAAPLAKLGRQLAAPDLADRLSAIAGLEQYGAGRPAERQVVIDLLCEHLRTFPAPPAMSDGSHRAAQRVLRMRLNTDYARDCWAPLNLDLSGAHLHDLDLGGCILGELMCRGTHFHGTTRVNEAIINRFVSFDNATFTGDAEFTDTYFGGSVRLVGVQWHGRPDLQGAGGPGLKDWRRGDPAVS
jgi:hypothetical protein